MVTVSDQQYRPISLSLLILESRYWISDPLAVERGSGIPDCNSRIPDSLNAILDSKSKKIFLIPKSWLPYMGRFFGFLLIHGGFTRTIFWYNRNPLHHADEVYKLTPEGRKFFKNCDFANAKAHQIVKARRKALHQDNVSTNSIICVISEYNLSKPFLCLTVL